MNFRGIIQCSNKWNTLVTIFIIILDSRDTLQLPTDGLKIFVSMWRSTWFVQETIAYHAITIRRNDVIAPSGIAFYRLHHIAVP